MDVAEKRIYRETCYSKKIFSRMSLDTPYYAKATYGTRDARIQLTNDKIYLKLIEVTLSEWDCQQDEEAYRDLQDLRCQLFNDLIK